MLNQKIEIINENFLEYFYFESSLSTTNIDSNYLDISNITDLTNENLNTNVFTKPFSIYNIISDIENYKLNLNKKNINSKYITIDTLNSFNKHQFNIMKNDYIATYHKDEYFFVITLDGFIFKINIQLNDVIKIILSNIQPMKLIHPNIFDFLKNKAIEVNGIYPMLTIGKIFINNNFKSLEELYSYFFKEDFLDINELLYNLLNIVHNINSIISENRYSKLVKEESLISSLLIYNNHLGNIDNYDVNKKIHSLETELINVTNLIKEKYNVDISQISSSDEMYVFLNTINCPPCFDLSIIHSFKDYNPLIKKYLSVKTQLTNLLNLSTFNEYDKFGSLLISNESISDFIQNKVLITVTSKDLLFRLLLDTENNKKTLNELKNVKDFNHYFLKKICNPYSDFDKYLIKGILTGICYGCYSIDELYTFFKENKKILVDKDVIKVYLNNITKAFNNFIILNNTFSERVSKDTRISMENFSNLYKYLMCLKSDIYKKIYIYLSSAFNDFIKKNKQHHIKIEYFYKDKFLISANKESVNDVIAIINKASVEIIGQYCTNIKGKLDISFN